MRLSADALLRRFLANSTCSVHRLTVSAIIDCRLTHITDQSCHTKRMTLSRDSGRKWKLGLHRPTSPAFAEIVEINLNYCLRTLFVLSEVSARRACSTSYMKTVTRRECKTTTTRRQQQKRSLCV
jgi:hypothetical protein